MNNNTPYTIEQIEAMEIIGAFKNNWRQRNVRIYQHPDYPDSVVTLGRPFDGSSEICTVEDKKNFQRFIGFFNKVVD